MPRFDLVVLAASAFALVASGGPALASEPAPQQPAVAPSTAANVAKPEKLICRRLEVTGTRFPGPRDCRTEQQWRDQAQTAEAMTHEMQRLRTPKYGQ